MDAVESVADMESMVSAQTSVNMKRVWVTQSQKG